MTKYSYEKQVYSLDRLTLEIRSSSITIALDHMDGNGPALDIYFKTDLSEAEVQTLTTLVANHSGQPLPGGETDENGNPYVALAVPKDAENAMMIRPKTTSPGWMQQYRCLEFTSAKWNSLMSLDPFSGEPITDCGIKFFDAAGDEITSEANIANAVKTQVDWEPTWDYDIAGGLVITSTVITEDVRAWVVAAPDIPANYGGSKVNICGGMNLRFFQPGTPLVFDGRTPKRMTYSQMHTNKLRVILRHPAGVQAHLLVMFDTYRE